MLTFKNLQKIIKESNEAESIFGPSAELFARCRNASTLAHFAHLMTTSFAEHSALNTFYDEIVTLADNFAEAYIGKYGRYKGFPVITDHETDGITIVKTLRDWIASNRNFCGKDSELQNIIDEIVALCDSTLYKLENLK